ncbi:MAG: trimethylamine methyltransferase family protein, partial [Candidatus Omnitrophota bacterium]
MKLDLSPALRVLSEEEIRRIHLGTLEILENTGVRFLCKKAQEIFSDCGLKSDKNGTVYFPPELVEKCIRSVPPGFTRYPLDPKHKPVRLGEGKAYLGTGSTTPFVLDLDGNYRKALEKDIVDFARLSDAMENLPIGNGMIWAQDVPKNVFHARYFEALVKNNGKVTPAGDGLDEKTTKDIIHLVEAVLGGKDESAKKKTYTMTACPHSALTWGENVWVFIEAGKSKIPVEYGPMPFPGSMNPVTLAGTLIQMNAEILSVLVLHQLVSLGAPGIYWVWPGMMDMKVGTHVFGCPEGALIGAAAAQIAKYYEIPSNIVCGPTDSKIPDQQTGIEKMMTSLLPALAGADEIALFGGLIDFAKTANYEQVVIDNEIAGYIQRILQGIEVTDDKLALDVIRETGPGGNYLGHRHTLKYFREELHFVDILSRNSRNSWESSGGKDLRTCAVEKARRILKSHHPDPLSEEKKRELEKAVREIYQREGEDYKP